MNRRLGKFSMEPPQEIRDKIDYYFTPYNPHYNIGKSVAFGQEGENEWRKMMSIILESENETFEGLLRHMRLRGEAKNYLLRLRLLNKHPSAVFKSKNKLKKQQKKALRQDVILNNEEAEEAAPRRADSPEEEQFIFRRYFKRNATRNSVNIVLSNNASPEGSGSRHQFKLRESIGVQEVHKPISLLSVLKSHRSRGSSGGESTPKKSRLSSPPQLARIE